MNDRRIWFRRDHYPNGRIRITPTCWQGWLLLAALLLIGLAVQGMILAQVIASGASTSMRITVQVGQLLVTIAAIFAVCWSLSARFDKDGDV